MPKPTSLLLCAAFGLSGIGSAHAADLYPWRDHEAPFNFVFGNDIDTHQQTRKSRDGSLFGFFYVRFTGVVTKDHYPVATHVDCNMAGADCTVGWTLAGKPVSATFLYQPMHDHPVFLVNRADITQPGSPSHFHWFGPVMPMPRQTLNGTLLQLTAVDSFCFIHHGADAASPTATCRDNGGVNVDRGADIATHLNIVTSAPPGM
ncbi:hypothetical protein [Piscinibacter sp.]|jgi:hypothetical protein|uniref:hypothetical protein n=1 Tax=Piscinibacter sp. TaxID=1903157 RepID=UPI0035596F13